MVFAVEKKSYKKLQDSSSIKKIHFIDENICACFSGLNSDGRILVNTARLKAQSYRLDYEDDPTIEFMARHISEVVQKYTQKGGARPFGLSMFVAGFNRDHQPKLYLVEPSGMITSWKAHAIGKNNKSVVDHLQKNFKEDLTVVQGARLLTRSLCEIVDNPRQNLELAVITEKGTKFITPEELDKLVVSIEDELKK